MKGYQQYQMLIVFMLCLSIMVVACTSTAESQIQAPTPVENLPQQQPLEIATLAPIAEAEIVHNAAPIEPIVNTTFVEWVADETVVEGATSSLTRMEHGLYMTFNAVGLEPGEAYTVWWLIFNKPENCSDGECGLDDSFLMDENGDILLTEEGAEQFNLPGREAVVFSQHRATGSVVDADGTAEFRAHLPVGDRTEVQFDGPGLLDAMKAEVHLVIRTHGASIPGLLHEQMNTPWGGCPEGWPKTPCVETQLAIHLPPQQ